MDDKEKILERLTKLAGESGFLTPTKLAKGVILSRQTIVSHIQQGKLKAYQPGDKGYRITIEEAFRFLTQEPRPRSTARKMKKEKRLRENVIVFG